MELIKLPHYEGLDLPYVKDEDDAGIDLRAAQEDTVVLAPSEDYVFPTGLKIHIGSHEAHTFSEYNPLIPKVGIYGCILPRSGLGFKHYTRLANTAGVIDAGYTNEIMVKVRNEGTKPLEVKRGARICQMVFHLYVKGVEFKEVEEFTAETTRGENGFGDSGVQ